MWMLFYFDSKYSLSLYQHAILPRSMAHWYGLFLSPFIHGSLSHLFSNSIPFLVLATLLYYYYAEIATKILFYGILISGVFVWLTGNLENSKSSFHLGASGIVYCLAGFLIISGFIRKHKILFSISLLVIFLYGTFIWGVFPIQFQKAIAYYQGPDNISWESHLGGLLAGILLSLVYKNTGIKNTVYSWENENETEETEENPYWMEGIDEDPKSENKESDPKNSLDPFRFNYEFLPKKDDGKEL